MKKIICLFFSGSLFITQAGAQVSPPEAVKKSFDGKFPGAKNVTWVKESTNEYEAEFNMGTTAVAANFKSNGSWVVTETIVTESDLPAAVSKAVQTKYPGSRYSRIEKVEKPDNKSYYEAIIWVDGKKREVELNDDGKFLK